MYNNLRSQATKIILQHSIKILSGTTFVTSFCAATYYRPIPHTSHHELTTDYNDNKKITTSSSSLSSQITILNDEPNRNNEFLCSNQLPIFSREDTPFWLQIAQNITIGLTTIAIRIFMNTYGQYDIVNDEHYHHFLELALGGRRKGGREEDTRQGLITVSNHRSLFDDPGVVSCLLPLWVGVQPRYNRWGICAQEYCFSDKLPSIIKGYIGAGQVLPIRRGCGIDQALFRDFAKFLANGEWCHIFPEGGIWQDNELGGRGRGHTVDSMKVDKSSKLKWGVGKLIAHAPVRPRVIPFAHRGMDVLLPKDPVTGKSGLKKKIIGGEPLQVLVRFGEGKFTIFVA
jgi:1-acyl-sn-glycerol-3-phosphate acyltransferase